MCTPSPQPFTIVKKLLKDLNLIPEEWLKNKKQLQGLVKSIANMGDVGNYWRTATLLLHVSEGCQMWVSKEVSDDMQATSIFPEDLDGVEWPHHAMEIYYEDQQLPTFLVRRESNVGNGRRLAKLVGMSEEDFFGEVVHDGTVLNQFQAENEKGEALSMTLSDDHLKEIAAGSDTDLEQTASSWFAGPMDKDETKAMEDGVALFLKLLVFVSAERESIHITRDQPTRKQGGKAGFKNRPKSDRLLVVYLPHHKVERERQRKEHLEKEAGKRTFNGRRAHWRRFHSDFYKTMKGKKKYIFPIPGPDGTVPRKKFVVRNPK